MRKFKLFILFMGILSFLGFQSALKATPENSDAKIAYYLDGEEVVAEEPLTLAVGGKFTPDAQTIDGTFLYWTINGAILKDLPERPTVRVTSKLHMKAYYVSSTKHAVVFLDTNLQVLKTQYAITDETLVPPADPFKPKTTFVGWVPMANYEEGVPTKIPTNPNAHEYFVARYTKDALSYTVKINGASQSAALNEVVEATTELTNPVWKDEHGNVLGCGSPIKFAVFGNIDITAYAGDVTQSNPYVTLRGPFSLREGYVSYIGKISPDADVLEFGFEYTKSGTVHVVQSNVINAETNEFLMSFLDNGKTDFKAYLKYMSGTDVVKVYSASAPKLTGTLYHWMPGAVSDTTGLVATIDLHGASYDSTTGAGLTVKINDSTLTYGTDYTIVNNELKVKGQALQDENLALGTHQLSLATIFGTGTMPFYVVDNPTGTSIPTTTIQGVNMTSVPSSAPTVPIANAPDLLITEMGLDRSTWDYIEVFNNTTEPYNLNNHRIVFGFFEEQDAAILQDNQLFTYPAWTRGAVFIYEDYIIPALSKAIIWVAATDGSAPWKVAGSGSPRKVSIDDASLLYGGDGLTIAKFKQKYNLGEDDLVFFTRPQFILFNNTSAYNSSTGLGAPVSRTTMVATNSSMDNRAVQIQKLDPNVVQELPSGDTTIPDGATYFKWDFGVANKEKDVVINGVISGVQVYGNRESIEAFYIRRAFYNASDEFVGYSTKGTNELNVHGGLGTVAYKNAYKSIATPIVTAIFYADLTKDGETITNNKWNLVSLEYTVPSTASYSACPHLMRFVQRDGTSLFSEYYASSDPYKAFKLAGLAPAVPATLKNRDIAVPVDAGYPTDYITLGYMTIGRTAWYNFYETEPIP